MSATAAVEAERVEELKPYYASEKSLWHICADDAGVRENEFPVLVGEDLNAHVVIVGGGLVGLFTAYFLSDVVEPRQVVMLEANTVGSGVTGHSTAKVSALHRIKYEPLLKLHGEETAQQFAALNYEGLKIWEKVLKELDIELEYRNSYVYTVNQESVRQIDNEYAACLDSRLPVDRVTDTDLPFPIKAAVLLKNQLQVEPISFCRKFARYLVEQKGVRIYEHSRVTHFSEGIFHSHQVRTADASILCDNVVLATHMPITDKGLHFAQNYPSRSYCSAFRVEGPVPKGMYITSEDKHTISIRSACNDEVLIIAGEGHMQGEDEYSDTTVRYKKLHDFARAHFKVKEFISNWSAHDFIPDDQLPYVGYSHRLTKSVYIATGYAKWGFALAAASGMIIQQLFTNTASSLAQCVSSTRFDPLKSAPGFAKEQKHVIKHLFPPRNLPKYDRPEQVPLDKDDGDLVRIKGKLCGIYKDFHGTLHMVSPTCKHLGCTVEWNKAERSWDCPCHGSRYDYDGNVLSAPSCANLERFSW